mmetsp:Transcript_35648/g.100929  ORF Transcript_35648/g.100929 Transcript_35648/m.100929 type:complete len:99 (+) Transcript_35648:381-677(+)
MTGDLFFLPKTGSTSAEELEAKSMRLVSHIGLEFDGGHSMGDGGVPPGTADVEGLLQGENLHEQGGELVVLLPQAGAEGPAVEHGRPERKAQDHVCAA